MESNWQSRCFIHGRGLADLSDREEIQGGRNYFADFIVITNSCCHALWGTAPAGARHPGGICGMGLHFSMDGFRGSRSSGRVHG